MVVTRSKPIQKPLTL
ncbi:hypothetical protein F383_22890 [Gossypium arboreum]|uniref:Uncharacterized protein n=1 Tax=Gossypium arboreum TaxID=29729 RepID=A0A0B0NYC3_GOSAR|nr:hypothetical protein F383_22890 [Gossypium arboreum]